DASIEDINPEELDMVVLPGGLDGVEKLKSDRKVYELLKAVREKGKYISAICAAPTALASFGLLEGKRSTVYPELKEQIKPALFVDEKVVEDSKIITSQGPGTAFAFGLRLVEKLVGRNKAREVAKRMLIDWNDTGESKAQS
ncbi:MAG: DJ-1 family glyoxalase III, partial [Aquificaceae bacterium]